MSDDFVDTGTITHIPLDAPIEVIWELIADFGGILRWWPKASAKGVDTEGTGEGMVRHIHTADGHIISEQLALLEPDDRIMELEITHGLPEWMDWYICRFKLMPRGNGCRLEWAPQASILAGTEDQFQEFIETDLGKVSDGLRTYAASLKLRST
jgi:hypothetical protein